MLAILTGVVAALKTKYFAIKIEFRGRYSIVLISNWKFQLYHRINYLTKAKNAQNPAH